MLLKKSAFKKTVISRFECFGFRLRRNFSCTLLCPCWELRVLQGFFSFFKVYVAWNSDAYKELKIEIRCAWLKTIVEFNAIGVGQGIEFARSVWNPGGGLPYSLGWGVPLGSRKSYPIPD